MSGSPTERKPGPSLRLGLSVKAALFVAMLFLFSAVGLFAASLMADRSFSQEDVRRDAAAFARVLASEAASGSPDNVASALSAEPSVTEARVLHLDLGAAEGGAAYPVARDAVRQGQAVTRQVGGMVIAAAPLPKTEGRLAAAVVSVSMAQADARLGAMMRLNLVFLAICLAFVLPISGYALHRAMRPVRMLTRASEQVARRDYDVRLDVRTGDELETLAQAFSAMVERTRASMAHIRRLAFVDELTTLPNKNAFARHLERAMADGKVPGSVLLINLDRFKRLNDTYGEREGDRILTGAAERLREVATRLRARYRHEDARPPIAARLGGDEFALLLQGPAPTGVAKQAARDVVEALSEPIRLADHQVAVTARVGIAIFPDDAAAPDHLMRDANLALDAAKADGGSCFRFFKPEMSRRAVSRVVVENDLRQAILRREFEVHFQPKIDTRNGGLVGCEALVRWRRRDRLVSPAEFIEVAEESGLIADIGLQVLEQSCAAARRWCDAGFPTHVAVNVSAVQFASDTFIRDVQRTLRENRLDPALLELELTESVAMHDASALMEQIAPLRAKGVRFAIDDFGTGYSSLASLTKLPFDIFKIDQSFVRNMETDPSARVVIETILAMARALGYDTVAEGVETETQLAFLRLNGCGLAQGWLFGKPVPEDEFFEALRADRQPAMPESLRVDDEPGRAA